MQHTTRQSRRQSRCGMAAHLIGAAAKSIHIAPAAGPAPSVARALTCSDVGGGTLTCAYECVRLRAAPPLPVACPVACPLMQPMKCSRLQASAYVSHATNAPIAAAPRAGAAMGASLRVSKRQSPHSTAPPHGNVCRKAGAVMACAAARRGRGCAFGIEVSPHRFRPHHTVRAPGTSPVRYTAQA